MNHFKQQFRLLLVLALFAGAGVAQAQDSLSVQLSSSPNPAKPNEASTLSIYIVNRDSSTTATDVALTINLPTGVVVASPNNSASDAVGGTLTAVSGASSISFTGGSISPLSSATTTLTVDVIGANTGDYLITSDELSSGNLGTAAPAATTFSVATSDALFGSSLTASVSGTQVTFDVYLENLDGAELSELSVVHDLDQTFGAGNYQFVTTPHFVEDPASFSLNPDFNGSSVTDLIKPTFNDGRTENDPILAAGDTAQIQFVVNVIDVTDVGSGVGIFQSQVATSARSSNGMTLDLSDDGTNPNSTGGSSAADAGEDDASEFTITPTDSIGAATYVSILPSTSTSVNVNGSTTTMAGTKVRIYWVLENLGDADLTDVTLTNDLVAVFGSGNFGSLRNSSNLSNLEIVQNGARLNINTTYNGSTNTTILAAGSILAPQERVVIQAEFIVGTLSNQGFGYGIYQNQVSVSGTSINGPVISDLTDSGTETDSNFNGAADDAGEDDPTIFALASQLGLAKNVTTGAGTEVTFDYYLEVFGPLAIENLSLLENLDNLFGEGSYQVSSLSLVDDPGSISLNNLFDGSSDRELFANGSSLGAGDTAQIRVVLDLYNINNSGSGIGAYSSSSYITGTQPDGAVVTDTSTNGTDPDPNADDNPSGSGESAVSSFVATPGAIVGGALDISGEPSALVLNLYLEGFGAETAQDIDLSYSLDEAFGAGNYTITSAPVFVVNPGTLNLNPSFDGSADTSILATGSSLDSGDTAEISLTVQLTTIDESMMSVPGVFSTQFTVTASDSAGRQVSDLSHTGANPDPDGNGDPTKPSTEDTPTSIVVQASSIGLAIATDVSGTLVTFIYTVQNTGETPVTGISLTHQMLTHFGFGNYSKSQGPTLVQGPSNLTLNSSFDGLFSPSLISSGSLEAGETVRILTIFNITNVTNQGSGFGIYPVQTTVSGTGSVGAVTDTSDEGYIPDTDGDGNPNEAGENDSTVITIGEEARIGLAEDVSESGMQLTFDFYVENLGSSTLSNISLSKNLDDLFGSGNYNILSAPSLVSDPGTITLNAAYDGAASDSLIEAGSTLATATSATIRIVVELTDFANIGLGLGVYASQSEIFATNASGTPAYDLSDFGTDPDPSGNGFAFDADESDPYEINFSTSVVGAALYATVDGWYVTLDYTIANLGNLPVTSLSLPHDLDAVFGAGNYTIQTAPYFPGNFRNIELNPAFDGSTDTELIAAGSLGRGVTERFRLKLKINPIVDMGSGLGIYSTQVQFSASGDLGAVSDLSDAGTVTDANDNGRASDSGENDSTTFTVEEIPVIGIALSASVTTRTVTLDYYLENFGNVTISGISVIQDLDSVFGAGNYSITAAPSFVDNPGTLVLDAGYDGFGSTNLLSSGSLAVGDTVHIQMVVEVTTITDQGSGPGQVNLQASVSGLSPSAVAASDLSDNGTDPDPNGNGLPNESGENDSTNFLLGTDIEILVWNDLDGDGVYDVGEPGISGVIVFLDNNDNGSRDGGEPSATTDGNGALTFSNIEPWNYSVQMDASTIPEGFVLTGGSNPVEFDLNNAIDFGLQQQDATIGDFVWNDLNGDGVQDGGEPGLSGVRVYLDLNSNGTLDGGEPNDTTDTNGAFDFTSLPTGTYGVTIDSSTVPVGFVLTGGTSTVSVTIAAGDDYNGADFGYQQQNATIGDFVWNDLNGDGVQDGGESSLSGVTVYLDLNSNGTLDGGEPSDTTDANGAYDFTGLPTGTYAVTVDTTTTPVGFFLTGGTSPDSVTIAAGEDYNGADFGYQQQDATIGDFVWNDLNGDGVQDGGEPSISGVTVYLDLNSNGTLDGGEPSDTTDANGAYDITALPTGTYAVAVDTTTTPVGFVLTGGSNPASVTIAAGEDYNGADFGYQQQDASIGDFVWNDLNGDSVQDGGEPGMSGVTIYLDLNSNGALDGGEPNDTTDANGAFDFTALPTGTYSVRVDTTTAPVGFVLTGGTNPYSATLAAGEDFNAADFGFQQQDASIGDFVWNDLNGDSVQDGGEPDISGITVYLDLNSNGTLDGDEPSDTTDTNGAYDFTGLPTGTYSVAVDTSTVPAGFVLTGGTSPVSVTIAAGEDYNGADFGYQQQDATIGDFVWNDLNGDGVQDGGEPGNSGITVYLDSNTNGTLDGGEPNVTTDANGAYDFANLPTGTYAVAVDITTTPVGFVLTGGTNPVSVTIAAGEDYNGADFGYQQQDANIGDFVWNDLNGDGVQDGSEPGLSGVRVYLDLNSNGTLDGGESSNLTDANGAYDITNLPSGTYAVAVDISTVPAGFFLTGGTSPDSVTIAAGEDYNDADFGYQQQDATLGDFVWNDLNGDGAQDGGEPGLSGVRVYLDLNSNGTLDGGEPNDTTDANGAYDFANLPTGTYAVAVDITTTPVGFVLTGGTNPVSVTIAAGEDYNGADFGYQQQDATIGDFVWNDLNGDGVQDAEEPSLSGVTVYIDLNTNGTFDSGEPGHTTDANGAYDFANLPTGIYAVAVDTTTTPVGFILTGGTSPVSVTIAAGEDYNNADFGYQQQDATIGDFVWNDLNRDGVQDGGEPGIANITVYLDLNINGSLDAGEPSDTTDVNGAYNLTALPTGTYAVAVDISTVPAGFVLTGGTSPVSVTIAAGEDYNNADFGYQQQDAAIGDFVWNDLNGDGVQDDGEPGLSGVTVYIDLNSNGTLDGGEPSDTSGANGAYNFTALPTGTYGVTIDTTTVPVGFVLTGGTTPFSASIAAGEIKTGADFGYQQQDATIGDFVWNDLNGDGVQDDGEPGLSGVRVYLDLNSNGALDSGEPNVTTDANGAYNFTALPTGTYALTIDTSTVPVGFVLTDGFNPDSVTIAAGEDYNDADFGYQQQDASIGDFVWNDLNGDGIQDASEPSLVGITVYIDANKNASFDSGEISLNTDADGSYDFRDLPSGEYTVRIDESTLQLDFVQSSDAPAYLIELDAGEDFNNADFGYRLLLNVTYVAASADFLITSDQGTPGLDYGDSVTWQTGTPRETHNLVYGLNAFDSIQDAILMVATDGIVNIAAGTYTEASEIQALRNVTLIGDGAGTTSLEGENSHRVLHIGPDTTVFIEGLAIANGSTTGIEQGAGIYNEAGHLILNRVHIHDNSAGAGAGIVSIDGILDISNSTIADNASDTNGGGILATNSTVRIVNSTVSSNLAKLSGGGIYLDGSESELILVQSTIANNVGDTSGGGIQLSGGATAASAGSIIAGNSAGGAGPDFAGTLESQGYNLIGDTESTTITGNTLGNVLNQDALLLPLAENGGPTPTHRSMKGSPAINAGDPAFDPTSFVPGMTTDQRGSDFSRVVGTAIDIGSLERNFVDLILTVQSSVNPALAGHGLPGNLIHQVKVTNHGPNVATNVRINITQILPAGVSAESFVPELGSIADSTWTIPSLVKDHMASLTITLSVSDEATPELDAIQTTASAVTADQILINVDNDNASVSTSINSSDLAPLELDASIAPNFQNSLIEQTLTVTNNNTLPVEAFRIVVTGLPEEVSVFNANGMTTDGYPYLVVKGPLPAESSMEVIVQFYSSTGLANFTPTYSVELLTNSDASDQTDGLSAALLASGVQVSILENRSIKLEWNSIAGHTYYIRYSKDLINYTLVLPGITAQGDRSEWIDSGPPNTNSHPASTEARFYQIFEMIQK